MKLSGKRPTGKRPRLTRTSEPTPSSASPEGDPAAATTGTTQDAAAADQKRSSPFRIGFWAAAGALLAYWLGGLILSVSPILTLVVVAAFLAVGLNPLVEGLVRRGMRRSHAVLTVAVTVVVALGLFLLAIVPVISEQVATIVDRAPDWLDQLQNNRRVQALDEKYGVIDRVKEYVADDALAGRAFGGALGVGVAVVSAVGNAFIVIVLTLYFLASLPTIKHAGVRLAPASKRQQVSELGDQILSNIGGYVSGAFLVATAAGISTLIFLIAVGLGEYAVALAVVVAVLDVIPMIGATLGASVVIAIAFATDTKIGVISLVFFIVYQQVENYVIYPRIMQRSVDIPGSLIVVAALIGASLMGVVGALLAIPTAAALLLLLKELFLKRQDAR